MKDSAELVLAVAVAAFFGNVLAERVFLWVPPELKRWWHVEVQDGLGRDDIVRPLCCAALFAVDLLLRALVW